MLLLNFDSSLNNVVFGVTISYHILYVYLKKIDYICFLSFLLIRISHVHLVLWVNFDRFLNKYHDNLCGFPLTIITFYFKKKILIFFVTSCLYEQETCFWYFLKNTMVLFKNYLKFYLKKFLNYVSNFLLIWIRNVPLVISVNLEFS